MKRCILIIVILIFPFVTDVVVAQPHNSTVWAVAYSPNGNLVATGSSDHTVKIWDVNTSNNIQTLTGHTSEVFDVEWNSDGTLLASVDSSGTILIWNTSTWQPVVSIVTDELPTAFFDLDWKSDDTQIAVSSDRGSVSLYSIPSGLLIERLLRYNSPVSAVAWSPNGNYLLSGNWDGNLLRKQIKVV